MYVGTEVELFSIAVANKLHWDECKILFPSNQNGDKSHWKSITFSHVAKGNFTLAKK
jgi:hypothetical protein